MWIEYIDLPNHLPHWRYEVNNKWYIGYITNKAPHNPGYACITSVGNPTAQAGIPFVNSTRTIRTPPGTDEENMQWLEMVWLTNTWKNYV